MLEKYFPETCVEKIQDISLDELKSKNIKGLLIDIDNTLVPTRVKEADENVVKWLQRVKENGFKVCILSNASKKRVVKFNDKLQLPAVYRAAKPWKRAYKKAFELMGLKPCETAMVGDQIFTDIYGGNRMGMHTILVKPIDRKEFFFVRLKRFPEKLVLSRYDKWLAGNKRGKGE